MDLKASEALQDIVRCFVDRPVYKQLSGPTITLKGQCYALHDGTDRAGGSTSDRAPAVALPHRAINRWPEEKLHLGHYRLMVKKWVKIDFISANELKLGQINSAAACQAGVPAMVWWAALSPTNPEDGIALTLSAIAPTFGAALLNDCAQPGRIGSTEPSVPIHPLLTVLANAQAR
eukprot:6186196-Pleurochrysis_carterae.AAC.1